MKQQKPAFQQQQMWVRTNSQWKSTATQLNEEGIPGPRGAQWRDTTIRGHVTRGTCILNNELYLGRGSWSV